jgi:hypothetical protein
MKVLTLLIAANLSFCSTTRKHVQKSHTEPASHHASKSTLVDSNWLAKYKAAEQKYGYHIEQDSQIKSAGGKYRVPREVLDHNLDMQKTEP